MTSKKRVNKTFEESCRTDNLFIDQTDGTHWCISKESPKSRKFDKEPCQLFACPNYISKEITSFSKKEKKIRGYIEKGKSIEFIMKNTPCSQATYYRAKKSLEEDEKRLEKEKIELDEESRTYQKTEKIESMQKRDIQTNENPLSDPTEKTLVTAKTRVKARNRVYPPLKPKIIHIKLKLDEFTHNKDAIEHALNNSNRWTPINIKEIREHLKKKEETINTSKELEWIEEFKTTPNEEKWIPPGYHDPANWYSPHILTKEELQRRLGIPHYYPEWMKHLKDLLDLWELSRKNSAIFKEELTTKEWYERMGIEFPKSLEPEANNVIENRFDLVRSGIFGDLEYIIKKDLKIDDEFEYYYHKEELDPFDKTTIKSKIRQYPNHPHSVLLKERLDEEEKN